MICLTEHWYQEGLLWTLSERFALLSIGSHSNMLCIWTYVVLCTHSRGQACLLATSIAAAIHASQVHGPDDQGG